jgi:DNA-binding transcriptional LysR family regulator
VTFEIFEARDRFEAQLGVALFDRQRTRKPTLTQIGGLVLAKARVVEIGVDDLRASVKGLQEGLEAEVTLVVEPARETCPNRACGPISPRGA